MFNGKDTTRLNDNTIDIYTSGQGSSGSKVSIHKATLLSALTVKGDRSLAGDNSNGAIAFRDWDTVTSVADKSAYTRGKPMGDLVVEEIADTIELDMISVGVITQALENIAYLRAQNGGSQSRLAFNLESLTQQRPICERSWAHCRCGHCGGVNQLCEVLTFNQAAASMLAQANASMDVALMLLR